MTETSAAVGVPEKVAEERAVGEDVGSRVGREEVGAVGTGDVHGVW